MTRYKEGRYTFYIIPESKTVKCMSTYEKKPFWGIAKCNDEDNFDEEVGKNLARLRCDIKINNRRIKVLNQVLLDYKELSEYYKYRKERVAVKLTQADTEKKVLEHDLSRLVV